MSLFTENKRLKILLSSASNALLLSGSTVAISGVIAMPENPTDAELIEENARIKSLLVRAANALEDVIPPPPFEHHAELIAQLRKAGSE